MRDGWRRVRLGEISTAERASGINDGSLPYVGLEHLETRNPRIQGSQDSSTIQSASTAFRTGDVLFGKLRPYLEKVAVAGFDGVCTNEILVWRSLECSVLERSFLGLILQSRAAIEHAVSTSAGSRMPRTSAASMGRLEVDLPPLAEQRRIVDLIAAIDEAIEECRSAIASERAMRSAVTRAFQMKGRIVRVADVATVAQGRSLPKAIQGEKSGSVPWYKIADMADAPNVYGYSTAGTMLTSGEITDAGGRVLPAGAVVFPRVGAAVLTEKKRILDVPGAVDENHLVLSATNGEEEVLLGVFENLKLSDLVQTGAVPSLNMQLVRELRVLWPEGSEVSTLNALLKASRELLRRGALQLDRLTVLRAEILAALLSGAHEIPESYDETMIGTEPVGAMS